MATYADGFQAMVGDEIEAIENYGTFFKLGDRFQDVRFTEMGHITATGMGGGFVANRFKLIRRNGAAPAHEPEQPAVKHEQSPEPLVKWPEPDKQPCSGQLPIGDFFTIEHDDQKVWRVVDGGYIAWFGDFSTSAYVVWPHNNTPVRRLKMLVRPRFEVI